MYYIGIIESHTLTWIRAGMYNEIGTAELVVHLH